MPAKTIAADLTAIAWWLWGHENNYQVRTWVGLDANINAPEP